MATIGSRGAERAGADAGGDERADAALVAIALGDDARAETWRKRVDLEVRRRTLDFVEQAEDVRDGQIAKARRQRTAIPPRLFQRAQQTIGGAILTEEEEFVLPAEVVVQVAWREVRGDGDVAHAGGGEPALAEHARRGAHDLHAAGVGTF